MSFYFPNVDPTYIYKRKGTEDDPFLFLVDENYVRYGSFVLKEIPSVKEGVKVTDSNGNELTEIHAFEDDIEVGVDEFRVDYTTGVITLNESRNGEKIRCEYYGTGYVSISASRVWRIGDNRDPVESLQDALEHVDEGVKILEQVGYLDFTGEYSETYGYRKWNFVTYNNKTYVAIRDNSGIEPTNTDYWKLVSSGVGFAGLYDESSVYDIGDLVTDTERKNMYVSKTSNNTSPLTDADKWDLILTLDDTVEGLVNTIDIKINELEELKAQLLESESRRDQLDIERDNKIVTISQEMESWKQELQDKEDERGSNELVRSLNENKRKSQETVRENNEANRVAAEEIRELQESQREERLTNVIEEVNTVIGTSEETISQMNGIIEEIDEIKNQTQEVVNQASQATKDLAGFIHVDEYNPTTTYYKNNIVTFDGSSYIAERESIGESIYDPHYWRLLAQAGRDGQSITVNGVEADEDGNIDLAEAGLATKDEVESVRNEAETNLKITVGDLNTLATLQKGSIVSAINELKRRIDDIIDVLA